MAVIPGELWMSGNCQTRCYPVSDMVFASCRTHPEGAFRVDFFDGEQHRVQLDDDRNLLEALRREIWEQRSYSSSTRRTSTQISTLRRPRWPTPMHSRIRQA